MKLDANGNPITEPPAPGSGQAPNDPPTPPSQEPGSNPPANPPQGQAPSGGMSMEDAQKAIKALREENAKHRTTNKELMDRFGKLESGLKGLFGDNDPGDPNKPIEDKITALEAKIQEEAAIREAREAEAALTQLAYDHKIPNDERDYFEFLIEKELGSLKEGEQLSQEAIEEIAKKVRVKSAPSATSVTDGEGGPKIPSNKDGEVTIDEFKDMSMGQKSALYSKDPALYNRLMNQAKQLGVLV